MLPINAVGKLGDNCKVEYVGQNQTPVAKFSVAVTIKKLGQEKQTLWLSCAWWGKVAQSNYIDYLTKGREIFVSGEIVSNNVGNNGKAYLNVNVNNASLTSGTKQQEQPQKNQQQGNQNVGYGPTPTQQSPQQNHQPKQSPADLDDDLPF